MIKEVNGLTVEWDTSKNEINKKKHGVSFEAKNDFRTFGNEAGKEILL